MASMSSPLTLKEEASGLEQVPDHHGVVSGGTASVRYLGAGEGRLTAEWYARRNITWEGTRIARIEVKQVRSSEVLDQTDHDVLVALISPSSKLCWGRLLSGQHDGFERATNKKTILA